MFEVTLILGALLFGGITLYAFGFAAFLFTNLPAEQAGPLLRKAFPHFYTAVIVVAALAAMFGAFVSTSVAVVFALIALTTVFARQILMPAINRATDDGAKARFARLHAFSVVITLGHILGSGAVVLQLGGGWPMA